MGGVVEVVKEELFRIYVLYEIIQLPNYMRCSCIV